MSIFAVKGASTTRRLIRTMASASASNDRPLAPRPPRSSGSARMRPIRLKAPGDESGARPQAASPDEPSAGLGRVGAGADRGQAARVEKTLVDELGGIGENHR